MNVADERDSVDRVLSYAIRLEHHLTLYSVRIALDQDKAPLSPLTAHNDARRVTDRLRV